MVEKKEIFLQTEERNVIPQTKILIVEKGREIKGGGGKREGGLRRGKEKRGGPSFSKKGGKGVHAPRGEGDYSSFSARKNSL